MQALPQLVARLGAVQPLGVSDLSRLSPAKTEGNASASAHSVSATWKPGVLTKLQLSMFMSFRRWSTCGDEPVAKRCALHFSSRHFNATSDGAEIVDFDFKEHLFQFVYHSIISTENFVVNVHILEKVSRIHAKRSVNLAGVESKISRCIRHNIFPVSCWASISIQGFVHPTEPPTAHGGEDLAISLLVSTAR